MPIEKHIIGDTVFWQLLDFNNLFIIFELFCLSGGGVVQSVHVSLSRHKGDYSFCYEYTISIE